MQEYDVNQNNDQNQPTDNDVNVTDNVAAQENIEEIKESLPTVENSETEEFLQQPFNPITYTQVKPVEESKPLSRGFKLFCIIMSAVIALSGTSLAGYFIGKSSITGNSNKKIELNLAQKPTDKNQLSAAGVYEKVNPSVVGISVYNSKSQEIASGVIYSEDGYIVTNDHIYSEIAAPKFKVYTYDGKEYNAEYVAGDKVSDLAVLKINDAKFTPATFGNSDELICGEDVVAIGRPTDAKKSSTITMGIISATDRRVSTTTSYSSLLIQTDSAINPGSSGGALVNMYGQVIGITSAKLMSKTSEDKIIVYDSVGYAIPTTVMKRIVTELIEKGKVVSRAKLGITYTAIDSVLAEINNYNYTGLCVVSVEEDSDLYTKVNEGDVITQINGKDVTSDSDVLDIIDQSRAGDKINVTVVTKNGATKNLTAVLRANTGESSYVEEETLENNAEQNGPSFNFPFGE